MNAIEKICTRLKIILETMNQEQLERVEQLLAEDEMKHIDFKDKKIRVGVIKNCFCYQPWIQGRLGKAMNLFDDKGSENIKYLEDNFDVVTMNNGDFFLTEKLKEKPNA